MALLIAPAIVLGCLLVGIIDGAERTLVSSVNPDCMLGISGCATYGTNPPFTNNLLYTVSRPIGNDTKEGSYRIYWSTIGAPTILLTEAPNGASEKSGIIWQAFLEDNTPEVPFLTLWNQRYVAITLMSLIEFDDVKNTGRVEDASHLMKRSFADVHWYNLSLSTLADDNGSLTATFIGTFGSSHLDDNITLELKAHTVSLRSVDPPRMLGQSSSMSMRIILNHTTVHYDHSRFAVEVIYASNDSSRVSSNYSAEKSISDEFSPGIFTVEKISGRDTYLQWRPVVYTAPKPGVTDSTRSQTGKLMNVTAEFVRNFTDQDVPYSLLLGLVGIRDPGTTLTRFNISFGQADDGFYNSTAFQEWTCELGLGQPPVDEVSDKIKLIIGIGFGLPAALIVIGGAYVAYLKIQKRRRNQGLLITDASPGYQAFA